MAAPAPPHAFHQRWEWRIRTPPDVFWPYLADTNRFNFDRGNASLTGPPELKPVKGRRRFGIVAGGMRLEWDEEPFEWVKPYYHSIRRRFLSGPMDELFLRAELHPDGDGSIATYDMWITPRGQLGRLLVPLIGQAQREPFDKAFAKYEQQSYDLYSGQPLRSAINTGKVTFAPLGEVRLNETISRLGARFSQPDLALRLGELIHTADDLTVAHIRPYEMAGLWAVARKDVLELFLYATQLGILEFQWELLCPLCRGAKLVTDRLGSVQSQVHCEVCNIDYVADFQRSIEMTFHPSSAIREVDVGEYCVGGPQVTPHIMLQQLLQPGEQRTISLSLEEGSYRLRCLGMPGSQLIQTSVEGQSNWMLNVDPAGWSDELLVLGTRLTLTIANSTGEEQLMVLERLAWMDRAVTAFDATVLQTFRDLFAQEALRPGEQILVGSLAILFTDLKDSTRLYNQIGDAPAFGLVMSHFDVLREEIDAESGCIVKTIGDAVMAVFKTPAAALRALLTAQRRLAQTGGALGKPLVLKAGIHYGPCIGVSLNDRLDYFGSAVNIAARLQSLSAGDDVVISTSVHNDPEVAGYLSGIGQQQLIVEPVKAALKGFDDAEFELWVIARR